VARFAWPGLLGGLAQTLVCMSAPQLYQWHLVEIIQTWHEESLYQMAEGRRHKGQCLRHPQRPTRLLRFRLSQCLGIFLIYFFGHGLQFAHFGTHKESEYVRSLNV